MTCMKSLITGLLSAVALDGVSGVPAAAWQKAFDEPYRPIWMKRVKGYAFVGSHWKGPSGDHGIGDFLSQQGDALKGDRPFFYVQHPTPAKTCCGEKAWGQDDGCSTQALSIYPNAVAISGHCHLLSTPPGPFPSGAEIRQEVLSDRIRLEIPAVCVVAGASPVKDYIVEAWNDEDVPGKLVFSRAVFGPGAFFAAEREQGPVVAEFSRSLFRGLGSVCFKVYAREAFGKVNAGLSRKVWLDA